MAASAGMRVAVKRAREVEARELEAMVAASAGMRVAVVKVRVAEVRVAEVMAAVQTVVVMVHQWTPSLSMSLSQPRPS